MRAFIWLCLFVPIGLIAQINLDSLVQKEGNRGAILKLLQLANETRGKTPKVGLQYANQAYAYSLQTQSDSLPLKTSKLLGILHTYQGEYDSALAYFFISLSHCDRSLRPEEWAGIEVNIASVFIYKEELQKAISHFTLAQTVIDSLPNPNLRLSLRIYYNFASIYDKMDNKAMALDYLKRSLSISRKMEDPITQAHTMNAIGEVYRKQNDISSAQPWYNRALAIFNDKSDERGRMIVLNNMATLFLHNQSPDKAKELLELAIEINSTQDNKELSVSLYINMGIVYRQKGEVNRALTFFRKAESVAIQEEYLDRQVEILDEIQKTYEGMMFYSEAYQAQKKYYEAKDSLNRKNSAIEIAFFQNQFDVQVKQNEELRKISEIQKLNFQRQQLLIYIISGGLGLITLLALAIWSRYRLAKKLNQTIRLQADEIVSTNKQLLAANKELQEFTYIVSHDLKEPMRTIKNYVKLIEENMAETKDDETREFIGFAIQGVDHMNRLLDDMVQYSMVKTKSHQVDEIQIDDIVMMVRQLLANQIETSGATIEAGSLPVLHSNRSLLVSLFQNLISNAMKFRGEVPPVITINWEKTNSGLRFAVSDNGIGIPEKYHQHIFSLFSRIHHREKFEGTGIGLSICKKIVSLHNGKIWVTSEPGSGSTFFFELQDLT